jgi:hypothetical protein
LHLKAVKEDIILLMAIQNTIFALFGVTKVAAVQSRLDSNQMPFVLLFKKVGNDSWFLIAPPAVTTQELSAALGISDGTTSDGIIVRVDNYWGRSNPGIWEWLTAKRGVDLVQSQA